MKTKTKKLIFFVCQLAKNSMLLAPLVTHIHTHTHTRTHTHTHARTHTHAHTHALTHAHTHTRTHTRAHTYTHAHPHTRTHAHTSKLKIGRHYWLFFLIFLLPVLFVWCNLTFFFRNDGWSKPDFSLIIPLYRYS